MTQNPKTKPQTISGGHLLAAMLSYYSVARVYGVPGESFLALLDGLLEEHIPYITCRQEGGAAMMAESEGKLTGRVGVCAVTRGPGATNASAGVHVALQDSSPMLLLVGQVDSRVLGREAFQEVDLVAMFAPLAKWSAQIDSIERIPEFVHRAFRVATSGRPGPVVLSLPENILSGFVEMNDQIQAILEKKRNPEKSITASYTLYQSINDEGFKKIPALLESAKRPLMILGGGGWNATACKDIEAFINKNPMPVMVEFRRQDLFPNQHGCYAGHMGFNMSDAMRSTVDNADVIVMMGARLGEVPSQDYTLINSPQPRQKIIHIHPDAHEIGRVYQVTIGLVASMPEAASALAMMTGAASISSQAAHIQQARQTYEATLTIKKNPGSLQMGQIVQWLNGHLDKSSILCNGAGNYAIWLHRYYQWQQFGTQLAPASGSMGYGLPAGIAAALRHQHDKHPPTVLVVAGDGDFLMTGQELSTAMQQRLPLVIMVVNNGLYGTIRMHQEKNFANRPIATDLHNPDFVKLAQSYGLWAQRVETPDAFITAFSLAQVHAQKNAQPVLLELIQDGTSLTPMS